MLTLPCAQIIAASRLVIGPKNRNLHVRAELVAVHFRYTAVI